MKYILAILISCSLIPQLLFAADPSGTPTAAEIARYKDLVQNDIDIIMYRPKEPHTPEVEAKWQEM